MKIYTTPCVKVHRSGFKFLRRLLPDKTIRKRELSETPPDLYEQNCFARHTRQHIQNTLERTTFCSELPGPALNNSPEASINAVLEEVARNIAKMDQNLYSAKTCMEEILRVNATRRDSVSLN